MSPRSLVGRIRRGLASSRFVTDALVAATVAVVAAGGDLFADHAPVRVWLFDIALVVPLLGRRRWPVGVFLAVSAVAFVQWIVGAPANGDFAVLVALYSVGAHEQRRWLVAMAAGIAEIGAILAALRWAPPGATLKAFVLLTGTATAAWVIGVYTRTRRAYLASVLDRAATAERDRDQQAQIAVAAERTRIAREMHDIVAHSLSVMIALNDGAAAALRTAPGEAREAVQQASTVGRQALAEMHRLLAVLRADSVAGLAPLPGDAQLDDLITRVRSAGLTVELVVTGRPWASAPGAQLAVHRIVQEALTNVLKHAPGASQVVVTLRYSDSDIDIEVVNDDRDVRTPRRSSTGGLGLTGMRERASVYGGQVQSGPERDGGWRVATRLHLLEQDALPA